MAKLTEFYYMSIVDWLIGLILCDDRESKSLADFLLRYKQIKKTK